MTGDLIGIIPASGLARRLGPLPFSKEVYPVGFRKSGESDTLKPKVATHYLLEKMSISGVEKAYVIVRKGKWDIPNYFGDGRLFGINLAYLIMGLPYGVPFTVDQAYPFAHDARICFGFPDILFWPEDAFKRLLAHQDDTNSDIVLGLFPVDNPEKWDMVEMDENGKIRRIVIKPDKTDLRYAWINSVWTPRFTLFMHEYLRDLQKHRYRDNVESVPPVQSELYMGDIIQAAVENNVSVDYSIFDDGACLDIGTADDLANALSRVGSPIT